MDIVTTAFFLDTIPSAGTHGISFSPSTNPGQLQIFGGAIGAAPAVFPQGYQYVKSMTVVGGYQTAIAEVPGVWTVTEPTLVANTTYGFSITQYQPFGTGGGEWNANPPFRPAYNTGIYGTTAGLAATAWAAEINNLKSKGLLNCTAVAVGAVLTITAGAGFPLLLINEPVGIVAIANGTPGVQSLGYPTDLANAGYTQGTPPAGYLSTGIYDKIVFQYETQLTGAVVGSRFQVNQAILWADQGAANFAAWKTYLLSVLEGTISGFAISTLKTVN